MSRPPRFRTAYSTTGEPLAGRTVLDYLPDEFADLLDEQRTLASHELGFPPSTAQGDFAGTLMELAALLGHTLGAYQDRYANDAFLGTALTAKALVRHGRRLGYEPGPGLAATGYALLTLKDGVSGTVLRGLAMGSASVGEKKAQDYETTEDLAVSAAWSELLPYDALAVLPLSGKSTFEVEGTGFGIAQGDFVVIERGTTLSAHEVSAPPVEGGGRTRLTVKQPLTGSDSSFPGAVVWAKPAHDLHLFGWNTSAASFTEAELRGGALKASPASYPASGYTVTPANDPNNADDPNGLYLSEELKKSVIGTPGVRVTNSGPSALRITAEASRSVTFSKVNHVVVQIPADPTKPNGTQITVLDEKPTVSVARTVTAIQATVGGTLLARSDQAIRTSRWVLGFGVKAPLVATGPNPAVVTQPGSTPVRLDRLVADLEPGRLVALAERGSEARFEIVRLTSVGTWADGSGPVRTQLTWEPVEPPVAGAPWTYGALRILGNVARISHGKTATEVLGGSDGSTPFLRLSLKQKPLTYLPSPDGAEPELEIRVADVLWHRVVDFVASPPEDRCYLVQRDETGTVSVVFGDGIQGAIPSSGRNHIVATYRTGIGPDGDADAFAVSRLKKAHALVERAANPLPVKGGAAPAEPEAVRTKATGYIRTFDRAVSVEDHKQLALQFPGVVKANAEWTKLEGGAEGIRVVVSDAKGTASNAAQVKAFLQARRDTTVLLDVAGPELVGLTLTLTLESDPAYLRESVERAVRDALCGTSEAAPGLFAFGARDLGQPAFLSELYEHIERAPGVRFIELRRFDTLEEVAKGQPSRVADTVIAWPNQLLVLTPQDIEILLPEAP
ncbi:baseplate J/gp47 family protein [Corallococcus sp. EGB]|uniref:baseplate J/gp47 family protein n=1 Tax=Corallococcus sp. EGB TaxID=1521117 RepID=UPI001CBE9891|nr:baseplate J/gp47 family protein [Corallococcus sp. EGB]